MAKKKEKKEKKAGKRMSKKQLAALLIDFFHAKQSETLSMKYIFSELHLTTHPQKMLCVDILHEMLDDDYISEIEKGKFRLNNHGTEMTGTFQRKSNEFLHPRRRGRSYLCGRTQLGPCDEQRQSKDHLLRQT